MHNCTSAVLFLACLFLCKHASAQQISPLQGQNWAPEGGAEVYVSAVVDRMLGIDDTNYRFEAVLYVWLSWRDNRALDAINASTYAAYESGNCAKPCNTDDRWTPGQTCCDQVFLPSFDITNVRGFSQDNVLRYGIFATQGACAWYTHLQGEFYAPFSFSAFPFDSQYLIISFEANQKDYDSIKVVPSLTGTQMYQPRSGDMVSGWTVRSLSIQPYEVPFLGSMLQGDPAPLASSNASVVGMTDMVTTSTGFHIIITVDRVSTYYIITCIVPIALNVYLALLVFAIQPKNLDTRLGVLVTLFLALTAILYVVNGYVPASSNAVPTQQLVIVSYFVLALIGFFSILTYEMVTFQNNCTAKKRADMAGRRFTQRWKSVVAERRASLKPAASSGAGLRRRSRQPGAGAEGALAGSGALGAMEPEAQLSNGKRWQQQQQHDEEELAQGAKPGAPWEHLEPSLAEPHSEGEEEGEDDDASQRSGSGGTGGSRGDLRPAALPAPAASELRPDSIRVGAISHHADDGDEEAPAPSGAIRAGAGAGAQATKFLQRSRTLGATPGWWLLRWASCCQARPRGGTHGLSWFGKQRLRLAEMAAEMERDKDYALYLALKVDKFMFAFTALGYTVAVVLIFAIGANKSHELSFG